MRISLEWLRDYVALPADVAGRELADELTLKTVEVEGRLAHDADTVFEIDNKSLTNRPDLWGHYGIAREVAAIYGLPLADPVTAARPPMREDLTGERDSHAYRRRAVIELELTADEPEAAPDWLRDRNLRVGGESSDALTDLGVYVMFATGQPVDVLRGTGRRRRLEIAALDPVAVRREAQRLGVRTEASARHEKGIDTQRVDQAMDLYLALLPEVAPGARATAMQDHDPSPTQRVEIELDLGFLDRRIGVPIDPTEVRATLEALGFEVCISGRSLRVLTPTWRSTGDVSLPEDVLEEVARIHGYESIPAQPLGGTFTHLTPADLRPLDRRVREQLSARAGMQEVVTYAWSTDRMLRAAGHDPADGVALVDPPAPDRATLRPSLVPNLLETAAANLRHSTAFAAFEVGTVFGRVPEQRTHAAAVLVGDDGPALFRRAKGVVEMLVRSCQIADLRLEPEQKPEPDLEPEPGGSEVAGPGWADRQVRLALLAHEHRVGTLALLATRARRLAGIDDGVYVACFEVNLDTLTLNATRENSYRPVSEWPEGEFDLSVVVPECTTWARMSACAAAVGVAERISYVGEFRGGWVAAGDKSVTLRVSLRPSSGTLGGAEIATAREKVIDALASGLGARLRG